MSLINTKIAQSEVKELKKQAEKISQNTNLKFEDVYRSLRNQLTDRKLNLFIFDETGKRNEL